MKKIILTAAAALLFTSVSVSAQGGKGVNKDSYLKKIERSNEDIANPKKNTKPAVWISRGDIFTEAGAAVTARLFKTLDEESVRAIYGTNPQIETEVVGNTAYTVYHYPDVKIYLDADGLVTMWEPTTVIVDDPYAQAYDAYQKAYEIDPKSASKVRAGIENIAMEYKKLGDNASSRMQYGATADAFAKAYEIQMHPAVNSIDTLIVYNTGVFSAFSSNFERAREFLERSRDLGFEDEGNVYYYLYHSYYGLGQPEMAMESLQSGLAKYPNNSSIIEGLVTLYSNTEGSDPSEIVPLVEKSIEKDPNNHLLWSGLGGVYDKIGEHSKAIDAYKKSVELAPNDFVNNFRLGYSYAVHADAMQTELNSANLTSATEYNERIEKVNDEYQMAIAPLEAAHKIRPNDPAPVALLKSITFRLREREAVGDKYQYYDELFKQMNP